MLIVHGRCWTSSLKSLNNLSKRWSSIRILIPTVLNQRSVPFRTRIWNRQSFLMCMNHHGHLYFNPSPFFSPALAAFHHMESSELAIPTNSLHKSKHQLSLYRYDLQSLLEPSIDRYHIVQSSYHAQLQTISEDTLTHLP